MSLPYFPPLVGDTILMQWGEEYVVGKVLKVWQKYGYHLGHIDILERSDPKVFNGSADAINFAWEKVEWILL